MKGIRESQALLLLSTALIVPGLVFHIHAAVIVGAFLGLLGSIIWHHGRHLPEGDAYIWKRDAENQKE